VRTVKLLARSWGAKTTSPSDATSGSNGGAAWLIKTVGKDGGYIMDSSTGLDDAKPENVKAMFDVTREYGVY